MKKSLIILNMLLPLVMAEDELYSSLGQSRYEPNYFAMLIGLFFVIGLIYLTGYIYKKLIKIKLDSSSNDEYSIKIVSSASLGQNKMLHIIKINNEHILVGATNNSISHIKDLDEVDKKIKEKED